MHLLGGAVMRGAPFRGGGVLRLEVCMRATVLRIVPQLSIGGRGIGDSSSQVCNPWKRGSTAISRCNAVVPVRGTPTITTGLTIGAESNPGLAFIEATAWTRPPSAPTSSPQAARRPVSENCGS